MGPKKNGLYADESADFLPSAKDNLADGVDGARDTFLEAGLW